MEQVPVGPKNKEIIDPKQVWIIDDNQVITRALARALQYDLAEQGCTATTFNQASSAMAELKRRREAGEALPGTIFVDGHLDAEPDESPYREGVKVVKDLRQLIQSGDLDIVAFSSDSNENQKMTRAGASGQVEKGLGSVADAMTKRILSRSIKEK